MFKFVDVDAIRIDTRQRKRWDKDKLEELMGSILSDGLMYPPIVRLERNELVLIAGWRRLTAIKRIYEQGKTIIFNGMPVPQGKIPVMVVHVSKDKAEVLEFAENEFREKLDWRDRAQAIAELHKKRLEQTGGKHTAKKTAEEIGVSETTVAGDLLIARYLDHPHVKSARKRVEALKAAKRLQEAEDRRIHAKIKVAEKLQQQEQETKGNAQEQTFIHTCIIGDAFELLPKMEGDFAAIIADPPYGVEMDTVSKSAMLATKPDYDDSRAYALECYELLAETIPNLMTSGYAFIFLSSTMWNEVFNIFAKTKKFHLWSSPLIWYKDIPGWMPSDTAPRKTYDMILMARIKPKKMLKHFKDVLIHRPPRSRRASKKPESLYRELLGSVVVEGEEVLDPFCGMGTIFEAANALKLVATGIERDEDIAKAGAGHIEGVKLTKGE